MSDDYVTMTEARLLLGVSKDTLRRIVAREQWPTIPNPEDGRSMLLPRTQVERLAGKRFRDYWRERFDALLSAVEAEPPSVRDRIMARAQLEDSA